MEKKWGERREMGGEGSGVNTHIRIKFFSKKTLNPCSRSTVKLKQ